MQGKGTDVIQDAGAILMETLTSPVTRQGNVFLFLQEI